MGKLYGVGVGPGDPELMTLKAYRVLSSVDVIVVPHRDVDKSRAYRTVRRAIPEIEDKIVYPIDFIMSEGQSRKEASIEVEKLLLYYDVAFVIVGDPMLYSTFAYIYKEIRDRVKVEIVSGITSISACSAVLKRVIGTEKEEVHIIPGCDNVEETLNYPGTKVYMRSKDISSLRREIKKRGLSSCGVSKCGDRVQQVYSCSDDLPESCEYMTTIFVFDGESRI